MNDDTKGLVAILISLVVSVLIIAISITYYNVRLLQFSETMAAEGYEERAEIPTGGLLPIKQWVKVREAEAK